MQSELTSRNEPSSEEYFEVFEDLPKISGSKPAYFELCGSEREKSTASDDRMGNVMLIPFRLARFAARNVPRLPSERYAQ